MNILKPLAEAVTVTAANTVSNSQLLYIYGDFASTITIQTAGAANTSIKIAQDQTIILEKEASANIIPSANVTVTPVAYKG